MDAKEVLLLWFIFLIKKTKGSVIENEIKQNWQLGENYTNQLLENFKKRKVYSSFTDNIWVLI